MTSKRLLQKSLIRSVQLVLEGIDSAAPPDVRIGCAFPLAFGCAFVSGAINSFCKLTLCHLEKAQPSSKRQAHGRAQPFLTSGGAAEATFQKTPDHLCPRDFCAKASLQSVSDIGSLIPRYLSPVVQLTRLYFFFSESVQKRS